MATGIMSYVQTLTPAGWVFAPAPPTMVGRSNRWKWEIDPDPTYATMAALAGRLMCKPWKDQRRKDSAESQPIPVRRREKADRDQMDEARLHCL